MAAIAFFIFITLTVSSTIHARESQFFNKFSNKKSQPHFIPQSQDSGAYGLYAHQSPSATANLPENYNPVAYTTPIHSTAQDIPDEFKDPPAYKYNGESRTYNSQEQHELKGTDTYNSEMQGFDDARFMETENGGNIYNSEKQGMSDTRFLENGKYFYDVNMENLNSNANMNTQGYYENSNFNFNVNGGGYQNQKDQFNP